MVIEARINERATPTYYYHRCRRTLSTLYACATQRTPTNPGPSFRICSAEAAVSLTSQASTAHRLTAAPSQQASTSESRAVRYSSVWTTSPISHSLSTSPTSPAANQHRPFSHSPILPFPASDMPPYDLFAPLFAVQNPSSSALYNTYCRFCPLARVTHRNSELIAYDLY